MFNVGDKVIVREEDIQKLQVMATGWLRSTEELLTPFVIDKVHSNGNDCWVEGYLDGSGSRQAMYTRYLRLFDPVLDSNQKEKLLCLKIKQLWERQEYYKCHLQ